MGAIVPYPPSRGGEGPDHGGGAGPAEVPGHPDAGRGDLLEVDTGVDPEAVQHPDQILGGEVPGGALGVGAAAEPARARVVRRDAGVQRGVGVGERLAVGVVEVHRELVGAHAGLDERADQGGHVAGRADADGVAEAELAGAEVEEPLAHRDDLVDRDGALPRVAEAHRHVGADVQPRLAGAAHGRLEHRELLVEAAVEVLLREGLGRRAEDRDVLAAELQRPVEAAVVRHQHREVGAAGTQAGHQVGGVGELGHPPGVHEAGRLDDREPGRQEPFDELGLDLGRDQGLLVLQAVARPDLVDRDPVGQQRAVGNHGGGPHDASSSTRKSLAPSATWAPAAASTAVTTPLNGAFRLSSIFIASITPSTSPSATAWPASTRTSSTVPGIGERIVPSPAAWTWSPKTSGRSKTCRWPWWTTSTTCGSTLTTARSRRPSRVSTTTCRSADSSTTGTPSTRPPARSTTTGRSSSTITGAGAAPERQPSAWNGCPESAAVSIAWVQAAKIRAVSASGSSTTLASSQAVSMVASRNSSPAASTRRNPRLVVRPRIAVSSRAATSP